VHVWEDDSQFRAKVSTVVSKSRTYLWGTGLEGLHSPTKELELALGELGSVALGSGGVVVVRHDDVGCGVGGRV
jgi:hypothetical protein